MFKIRSSWFHTLLAVAVTTLAALPATALNVQPAIIDLVASGRRSSALVTLQNTFTMAVPVELSAQRVELVDSEFRPVEGEVEDLLIFPAQTVVEPGQSQAFRIQWVGDPEPAGSRHYYVSVAQLPVPLPENENAIQVLYNFRVLVSVSGASATPALEVRSAAIESRDGKHAPVLDVHNAGTAHGYVGRGRMTIVQRAASGEEVFRQSYEADEIQRVMGLGLIPSGATRRLRLNVDLPRGDGEVFVTLAATEGR